MTIEQARAKRWSSEARAKQATKIRQWQPWHKSTGARTEQGKATSSLNACKGYQRAIYRNDRRIMSHGRVTRIESIKPLSGWRTATTLGGSCYL